MPLVEAVAPAAIPAATHVNEEIKQNQSGFQLNPTDWTNNQRTEADARMFQAYKKLQTASTQINLKTINKMKARQLGIPQIIKVMIAFYNKFRRDHRFGSQAATTQLQTSNKKTITVSLFLEKPSTYVKYIEDIGDAPLN